MNINTPGAKQFIAADLGSEVVIATAPGYGKLEITHVCQSLEIAPEDVDPLVEALSRVRHRRKESHFMSGLGPAVHVTHHAPTLSAQVAVGDELLHVPYELVSDTIRRLVDAQAHATQ